MLDSINIFEVSLTETIEYEYSHTTSKLVTLDRDAAMDRALALYSELNLASYVDSYTIEVRGGVLGVSGFDTLLYVQKVYLYGDHPIKRPSKNIEAEIDDIIESIARDASKRRQLVNGFGEIDLASAI
jgi:ABC-type arginine transport system ATPase subunit